MSNTLPLDYCRCEGRDCSRRQDCLRHQQLSNMGPRTPWMPACYVEEAGGTLTWPMFIPLNPIPAGRT